MLDRIKTNKHVVMFVTFIKILLGNQNETYKVIPKSYQKDITKIDYNFLLKKGLINLIFDVDNTITKVDDKTVRKDIIILFKKLKEKGFNIIIVSNNNEERVMPISKILDVNFFANAHKPKKVAYDKALKLLDSKKENTVMIGDQMLSDIKGASEYGIYSILVDPLYDYDNIQTKTSRILQNIIEKKLEKKKIFSHGKYYTK